MRSHTRIVIGDLGASHSRGISGNMIRIDVNGPYLIYLPQATPITFDPRTKENYHEALFEIPKILRSGR